MRGFGLSFLFACHAAVFAREEAGAAAEEAGEVAAVAVADAFGDLLDGVVGVAKEKFRLSDALVLDVFL